MKRRLISVLLSILLGIALLEILFRVVDPFGLQRYMNDLKLYYAYLIPDEGAYILPDGEYIFSNWTAHIYDGARFTASSDSDCTIAFVGDSVTFGLGVNDSDVWVNRLALRFQDVTFINKGLPGYNSGDVLNSIQRTPANGYVYLIIGNDSQAPLRKLPPQAQRLDSALRRNLLFLSIRELPGVATEQFLADVVAMTDNVLLIGFEGEPLALAANAHLISHYSEHISIADPHANRQGNAAIADSVMPLVEPFVSRFCHG